MLRLSKLYNERQPSFFSATEMIEIKRRAYTQLELERLYDKEPRPSESFTQWMLKIIKKTSITNFLFNRVSPFPRQLIGYKCLDFAADVIAGLTTGSRGTKNCSSFNISRSSRAAELSNWSPEKGEIFSYRLKKLVFIALQTGSFNCIYFVFVTTIFFSVIS